MDNTRTRAARLLDDGGPLGLRLSVDGEERVLALQTRICSTPECPTLHMSVRSTKLDAKGVRVTAGPGLELALDTVSGQVAEPPGVQSPFGPEVTRALLNEVRTHWLEALTERWRRLQGADEPGELPPGWSPGDLGSYVELFPRGWDLTVDHQGRSYLADDQYCLKPDCECAELTVAFIDLQEGRQAAAVRVGYPVRRDGAQGDGLGLALWQHLMERLTPRELGARYKRARAFARRSAGAAAAAARTPPLRPQGERAASVVRLRVHLEGCYPDVWRRLEVASSTPMSEVEAASRRALGRPPAERTRLHLCTLLPGRPAYNSSRAPCAPSTLLAEVASAPGQRLVSEPTDPDGWSVNIEVERTHPLADGASYPRVVDGEGALPPRAAATSMGFARLIDAFEDPEDPEHDAAVELLGEGFDPAVADRRGWAEVADAADDVPRGPEDIARVLDAAGTFVSERCERAVLEMDTAAGPPLLEILARPPVILDGRAEPSEPMVLAIHLLGLLGYAPGVPALLEALTRFPLDCPIILPIADALSDIGAPALEPLLEAHARATEPRHRAVLREALSGLPLSDERVTEVLLGALERDELHAARALNRWGDEAALPALRAAFGRALDARSLEDALALSDAILHLGGDLGPDEARLNALEARGAGASRPGGIHAPEPAALRHPGKPPGRNEPCWCGSGKKYKKCHLDEDQRRR